MSSRHFFLPAAALCVAFSLAGCAANTSTGATGAASPAVTPAASDAATSAAPAPTDASGSDAKSGPFPCSVFSLADIKAATGYDVVAAKPITAVGEAGKVSCEYVDAARHAFGIETDPAHGAANLQVFSEIAGTGAPVTGIGDSAWGNDSELAVTFGDTFVQISDDSDAEDESVQLAHVGLDKLKEMVLQVHAGM